MKYQKIKILSILILISLTFGCHPPYQKTYLPQKPPKLTVVIVIDQFAYHYTQKLKKYLKHGIGFLLKNGIVYENAHFPHGAPTTPTGHSAIATGTFANYHGFLFSYWFDENGKKIMWEDDSPQTAAVFSKDGLYDYGKSGKNLMVDTLSDQFILKSKPFCKRKAIAISYKPYACLPMAGQLGKAIWFDYKTGYFTTSKAYYKKMPKWLDEFNKEKKINELKTTSWNLAYPQNSPAYNFSYISDYSFAGHKFSLIKQPQKIENDFDLFLKTPDANQLLLDLAKKCLDTKLSKNKKNKLLLWISLGCLDMVGHFYGPDCMETIDMIYHLDKQLEDFIKYVQKKVGTRKVLFVLTSDHGIPPIPEIMHKQGFKKSIRVQVEPLIKQMNEMVQQKYGIKEMVIGFKRIHFFVNLKKLKSLEKEKQHELLNMLKKFLKNQPGIKNVWTNQDLNKAVFQPDEFEYFFQQQRYPGRNGQLICQPQPYCVLTTYPTGTSHRSPYEYDTHVPLVIYQKGKLQRKKVENKVWMMQLPVTLAKILGVQKPSASTFAILPGFAH